MTLLITRAVNYLMLKLIQSSIWSDCITHFNIVSSNTLVSFVNGHDDVWVEEILHQQTQIECKGEGVCMAANLIKWKTNEDMHLRYLSVMWGFLHGFVSFWYANTTVLTHRMEKKNHKYSLAAYQMWQTSMESDEKNWGRQDWMVGLPPLIFWDSWWIL